MPPKSKKSDAFAFVRGLFGQSETKRSVLKIEQRKADEEILDRVASLNLAIAEQLAPVAVETQDHALLNAVLGASREARACAESRKEVTGGGLAGGTPIPMGVTVRIDHMADGKLSEDFHDFKTDDGSSFSVQAGPSKTE